MYNICIHKEIPLNIKNKSYKAYLWYSLIKLYIMPEKCNSNEHIYLFIYWNFFLNDELLKVRTAF